MIQRAQVPDRHVETIAARIADAVRPWRIVLFGSRARGDATDESDYDMFVEVDEPRERLKEVEFQILKLFAGAGWRLDVKVRLRGEIERRRDDPGTVEWDVAREGRVLYADRAAPALLPGDGRVREPRAEPPESTQAWLESASRDLRHATRLRELDEAFWPEICWLSQQAVEKHMKALLVSRRTRPPRTHTLSELLATLRAAGCALPELDDDCVLLTGHAVTPRYPAGLDLGEEDAQRALAAAERIAAAVRAQLPPRLH